MPFPWWDGHTFESEENWGAGSALNPRSQSRLGFQTREPVPPKACPQRRLMWPLGRLWPHFPSSSSPDADLQTQEAELQMSWMCGPAGSKPQCDTGVLESLMTTLETEPRKCSPTTEGQVLKMFSQPTCFPEAPEACGWIGPLRASVSTWAVGKAWRCRVESCDRGALCRSLLLGCLGRGEETCLGEATILLGLHTLGGILRK